MSPIGGVGINLAIQDAVAVANLLADPLRKGALTDADLAKLQRRRELAARITQSVQVAIQNRLIGRVLADGPFHASRAFRLFERLPWLQRLPAYAVGVGVRPEHVRAEPIRVEP
jgi:2-polyprenyl-6-methoxyphenol hydroxylase-like FAD-dependent oxidoreductase